MFTEVQTLNPSAQDGSPRKVTPRNRFPKIYISCPGEAYQVGLELRVLPYVMTPDLRTLPKEA